MEKASAPREVRPGGVSDFRKLQPAVFSGAGTPLEAEQWLVDTTNLLKAARIPEADQVEVVKIQLSDIAWTWWMAEEERLEQPVTWSQFTASFYERFFPKTARREMQDRFIKLRQKDKTVEEYAAEFLRLSRFAPSMVQDEEDRAYRFQQGLWQDIQEHLASQELVTYSQVLAAARRVEQVISKRKDRGSHQKIAVKRSFEQIAGQAIHTSSPRRLQVCNHCKKAGHSRRSCRMARRQRVLYESGDFEFSDNPTLLQQSLMSGGPVPEASHGMDYEDWRAPDSLQDHLEEPHLEGQYQDEQYQYKQHPDEQYPAEQYSREQYHEEQYHDGQYYEEPYQGEQYPDQRHLEEQYQEEQRQEAQHPPGFQQGSLGYMRHQAQVMQGTDDQAQRGVAADPVAGQCPSLTAKPVGRQRRVRFALGTDDQAQRGVPTDPVAGRCFSLAAEPVVTTAVVAEGIPYRS